MKKKATIALWIKFGICVTFALLATLFIIPLGIWAVTPKPEQPKPTNFMEALGQAIGNAVEQSLLVTLIISIIVLVYFGIGIFVTVFTIQKLKKEVKNEELKTLSILNLFFGGFVAGLIMLNSKENDLVDETPKNEIQ